MFRFAFMNNGKFSGRNKSVSLWVIVCKQRTFSFRQIWRKNIYLGTKNLPTFSKKLGCFFDTVLKSLSETRLPLVTCKQCVVGHKKLNFKAKILTTKPNSP